MLNKNIRIESVSGTYYVRVNEPKRDEKLVTSVNDIVWKDYQDGITAYIWKNTLLSSTTGEIAVSTSRFSIKPDNYGRLVLDGSYVFPKDQMEQVRSHMDELLTEGAYSIGSVVIYTDKNKFKNVVYRILCEKVDELVKLEVERERSFQKGKKVYKDAVKKVSSYTTELVDRKVPSIYDYITEADEWWMSLDDASKDSIYETYKR